jgi:RNA polymerase-binding transcription factor DksA
MAKEAAPKKAAKKTAKAPAKKASKSVSAAKKAPAKAAAKKAPTKKASAAKKAPAKAAAKKAPTKKAAAAKKAPAKNRSPFSAAFLTAQKKVLLDERATYTRQADSLQAEADSLVADFVSSDAQFDEDGGEGDTLSSERERDLALSAQARAAVEEIDHALAKFDDGTYGICEASGEPIPQERLEAIPWARVQVQYKTGGIGQP